MIVFTSDTGELVRCSGILATRNLQKGTRPSIPPLDGVPQVTAYHLLRDYTRSPRRPPTQTTSTLLDP